MGKLLSTHHCRFVYWETGKRRLELPKGNQDGGAVGYGTYLVPQIHKKCVYKQGLELLDSVENCRLGENGNTPLGRRASCGREGLAR